MKYFLSCDWGTTSFRIRLADARTGRVLAGESSGQGIAETFDAWNAANNTSDAERVDFYLNVIREHIKKLAQATGLPLKGVKLLISGMASSSVGFINMPYSKAPVAVDGSGLETALIAATGSFDHDILLISGVKTADDVIRGEETQLIGCIAETQTISNEFYIFPGTHSKHIWVHDNRLTAINTYMTGEFFALLSQKSILKNAVDTGRQAESDDLESFKLGVRDAMRANLLHSVFKVRVNELFAANTKKENFNYLSGLLIGTELKDLKTLSARSINLAGGANLEKYYHAALLEIEPLAAINIFQSQWVDEAVVRGHHKIGRQLKILP